VPERPRASTVGINVNFLSPARAQDVTGDAHVIRRGQVSVIEVSVTAADGTEVARALVTYRL
jgi:acyl-coenzyme A thioesterase PaaI-like protein